VRHFFKRLRARSPAFPASAIDNQVNTLFVRLAADHHEAYTSSQRGVVTPLVEYWVGSARFRLWIMFGASLLLLAVSAISSSNLLLSCTPSRR
jgi:hypothetical protein